MSAPGWAAHARAILMPLTASVAIPCYLGAWSAPTSTLASIALVIGGALSLAGWGLVAWTTALFATRGRGTLAPWNPTQRLVVEGPFAHSRNPMISGVAAAIAGIAVALRSYPVAAWGLAFVAVNHAYFIAFEEPGLRRRFGSGYDDYFSSVPRWIPQTGSFRHPERSEPTAEARVVGSPSSGSFTKNRS